MKKIDFSENRNIYMPSLKMKLSLLRGIAKSYKYPDYKNKCINESVSSLFNIDSSHFCVTTGSLEGINLIVSLLKKENSKATIFTPTFWGYKDALNRYDYVYHVRKLDNMLEYNLSKINESAKTSDLIILCNPNNPTLSFIDKKDLISIVQNNPNCHFVIDETMLIFNQMYNDLTMYQEIKNNDNLSVVMSFSKILGISGLRAGIIFSNQEIIEKVNQYKLPYCNNILIENVLPVALSNPKYIDKTKEKISCNRKKLNLNLKLLGFQVIDNNTNYILVKIKDKYDIGKVTEYLRSKGLIVRNVNESYKDIEGNWLRISINRKKNNEKLVKTLGKIRYW